MEQPKDNGKRAAPKAENSNLPIVSEVIKDGDILQDVRELLKEASRLKPRLDEYGERLDEIKSKLMAIASAYDLSGFRHNKIGFRYSGKLSNKRLSKERIVYLLADAGIPVEKLADCYVDGEEYDKATIILFE